MPAADQESRSPAAIAASADLTIGFLTVAPLDFLEQFLADPAIGTDPFIGDLLERCTRRNAVSFVSDGRVIDIPTDGASPFSHCAFSPFGHSCQWMRETAIDGTGDAVSLLNSMQKTKGRAVFLLTVSLAPYVSAASPEEEADDGSLLAAGRISFIIIRGPFTMMEDDKADEDSIILLRQGVHAAGMSTGVTS